MRAPIRVSLAVLCGIHAVPGSGAAQSLWLDTAGDRLVAVEWLNPNFDGNDQSTFLTSVTFLSIRYRLDSALALEADIPVAHSGFSGADASETAIGNLYLGVVVGPTDQGVSGQLGVRLPSTPSDNESAQGVGVFTDIDRWEAFAVDVVPLTFFANYAWRGPTGALVRLRGGPSVWIPTGGGDTELLVDYAAQAGYEGERFRVLAGFSGSLIVTEDGDVSERTFNELGAAANLRLGQVRPGIHLRFPLDEDLNDFLDFVVGIHLGVALR